MSNQTKRRILFFVAIVAFLMAEALTFYAYSFLWLIEGSPGSHNAPMVNTLGWIYLGAMVVEFVALPYAIVQIYRRLP